MRGCDGEEVVGKGEETWDGDDGAGASGGTGEGAAEATGGIGQREGKDSQCLPVSKYFYSSKL